MTIFGVYQRYPFRVPIRVKFFNLFRYWFRFPVLENFLISRLAPGKPKYWRKLIPPLYFYDHESIRIVERDQIKYRLDISKQLDHSIYFYTVKDVAWDNLLQVLRPDLNIIDVGANIGYLSLTFAKHCSDGIIYAFEPDSQTYHKLLQNVCLNHYDNVKLFNVAVGKEAGNGKLYKIYASNPGANRILPEKPNSSIPSETVEISTLDAFEKQGCFEGVDMIKIDVEGFELFVLQGAGNLISRWKPILFIELIDQNLRVQGCSAQSVLQYLTALNYQILDARNMEPLHKSDNYYTDIICFPPQSK